MGCRTAVVYRLTGMDILEAEHTQLPAAWGRRPEPSIRRHGGAALATQIGHSGA
jgi:hypothetical protein